MKPQLPPLTLLKFDDPDYQEPTPDDVRTLKVISGKTGKELVAMVGVKDHRTFRRWTANQEEAGARQIPYSAWRLLLIELGLGK